MFRPDQQGATWPEVLIALVVTGLWLSGALALQQGLLNQAQLIHAYHVVSSTFREATVRRRLNPTAEATLVSALLAQPRPVEAPGCADDACTPDKRALADAQALAWQVRDLPSPRWQMAWCDQHPGRCLWLSWGAATECPDADGHRHAQCQPLAWS